MPDEQRLNSLDRFRKRSERLVLDEVPVGCGGLVLRWRNPRTTVPVRAHQYAAVMATCFLDGAPLRAAAFDLAPGRHVVAFALENVDLSAKLLMFAMVPDPAGVADLPARGRRPAPCVLTAGDGTWKCALDRPTSDDWKALDFDDRSWPALVAVSAPALEQRDFRRYQVRWAAELGAACLALPGRAAGGAWLRKVFGGPPPEAGSVWVRKVFTVTPA